MTTSHASAPSPTLAVRQQQGGSMNTVEKALRALSEAGYKPYEIVAGGEGIDVVGIEETLRGVSDLDDAYIYFSPVGMIRVRPYESDPVDVIVDYTIRFEEVLRGVNA